MIVQRSLVLLLVIFCDVDSYFHFSPLNVNPTILAFPRRAYIGAFSHFSSLPLPVFHYIPFHVPSPITAFRLALRLAKPTAHGILTVGIDVTRPPATKPLNRESTSHLPEITRTHLCSLCSKLEGRSHSQIPGHMIIQAINSNNATLLLPFTVDHIGGLGPLSIPLLFHPLRSSITHGPPLSSDMLNFTNEHSSLAFQHVVDSTNLHIADQATRIWKLDHPTTPYPLWFNSSYLHSYAMGNAGPFSKHLTCTRKCSYYGFTRSSYTRPPPSFRGPTRLFSFAVRPPTAQQHLHSPPDYHCPGKTHAVQILYCVDAIQILYCVRFPRMANRTGPLIYGGEPGESWNFSHSPDTPAL
jgi:hypothetical protein